MSFEREVLLVRRLLRVLLPCFPMVHRNKQCDVRGCSYITHAIWECDIATVCGIELGLRLFLLRINATGNEKAR